MGEIKHTLHAVPSSGNLFWEVSVGPEYFHQSVASCLPNHILGHTMDDAEAYARLFAAAPEMKKALERPIVYCAEDQMGTVRLRLNGVEICAFPHTDPRGVALLQFNAEQQAALAKATGEAPQ